jgi:DNA mismatch endonuclease Vsr
MSAIGGKNTRPEIAIRKLAYAMGYRYRLHVKGLPGQPDIVFPVRRKIIEVRGCFWHRHPDCAMSANPATRQEFWQAKFAATVARDSRNLAALEASGWQVLVIWECELRDVHISERLRSFLGPPRGESESGMI